MRDPKLFPDIFEASFILLCLLVIQIFISNIIYNVIGPFKPGDPSATGIISILSVGITLSFIMSYKGIWYREIIHFSPHSIIDIITSIIFPLIFVCFGLFILQFEANKIIESVFPMSSSLNNMFSRQSGSGLVSIITVSFIAPIIEELLFRGIILKSFIEQYSIKKSILISSLMFAVFHLNIYQFIIAFTFGILSGWLFIKTCSLFPSIIGHSIINSLTLIYIKLKKSIVVFPFSENSNLIEKVLFNLTGCALLILGLFLLYRIFRKGKYRTIY